MSLTSTTKRIYLDSAAATPVRPQVLEAMAPYFSVEYGNPGAIHQEGVKARIAIEHARRELAHTLHIRPEGIVFTGSGTESNNLALFGTIEKRKKAGIAYEEMEIVTTRIEHPSVLEVCNQLSKRGVTITYAEVDKEGLIVLSSLQQAISPRTVLVVCAYVNSEIGVVQPVGKIARSIREKEQTYNSEIIFHVDAAQAPLWLPCALDTILADSIALDAGKCCGPKGVGVLAFRNKVSFEPVIYGGGQEGGIRAGTENTPLVVGCVCAITIAQSQWHTRSEQIKRLRDQFISDLLTIDTVVLNGSLHERVANNVNVSVLGIDSEFMVITLDEHGIACSTKSACGGAKGEGSEVVRTVTKDNMRALSTVRFTLGEDTTALELSETVTVLRAHIENTHEAIQKLTVN